MQKRKKGMQDQTATQNLGVNELSGGDLEKTSGGEAVASQSALTDDWYVDLGTTKFKFKSGFQAKGFAKDVNDITKSGKFHDMRDIQW